jgi:hypothetical protein
MRIVNRTTFLAMPAGTVYAKYEPCCFGELSIKVGNAGSNDFVLQGIVGAIKHDSSEEFLDLLEAAGKDSSISLEMDFDYTERDGLYDADQLFAVWEQEDVKKLIVRLYRCVTQQEPDATSFPLGGMAGAVVQSAEKVIDDTGGYAHGDIVRITFQDGRKLEIESDYFTDISLSGVPVVRGAPL